MGKKDNSRALRDFGNVEEYMELGCSPKTIARLTGLDVPRVKSIMNGINKKKKIIRGDDNEKRWS